MCPVHPPTEEITDSTSRAVFEFRYISCLMMSSVGYRGSRFPSYTPVVFHNYLEPVFIRNFSQFSYENFPYAFLSSELHSWSLLTPIQKRRVRNRMMIMFSKSWIKFRLLPFHMRRRRKRGGITYCEHWCALCSVRAATWPTRMRWNK